MDPFFGEVIQSGVKIFNNMILLLTAMPITADKMPPTRGKEIFTADKKLCQWQH